jgi:anti-sigma factor RsiW
MIHDAEETAARYLGGQMSGRRRARFSQHLLDCDECWQEVATAQEGRRLLEATRTVAPAHLRDRVRALAQAEGQPTATSRRRRLSLPQLTPALVLSLVVVLLAAGGVLTTTSLLDRGPSDPPAVTAAVADFASRELPGRQLPAAAAPDLSALRLTPVGAGGGVYDGLAVDGYAYRDAAGRRLVLYLSDEAFPTAVGAEPLDGPDGPWVVRRGGVVVLCARSPHALLVVGEDDELVRRTAVELGVV